MAGDDGGTKTQRLQPPFGTSSSSNAKQQQPLPMSQFDVPQLTMPQFRGQIRQISPNSAVENSGKRVGIPPSHPQIPPVSPYSQIPANRPGNQQKFGSGLRPSHARSMSQPLFFAADSLPPLSPSPYREMPSNSASDQMFTDVAMEERNETSQSALPPSPFTRCNSSRIGEGLPPRKAHRRSSSDIPPSLAPLRSPGALDRSVSGKGNSGGQPVQLVKKESSWERGGEGNDEVHGEQKPEGEVVDDLFSAYMNLENIDALNSSGTDEKLGNKTQEDLDSRASGSRTNGGDSSDNEATSSVNESGSVPHSGMNSLPTKREGIKRTAGGDIAPTSRHYRSFSMDSFMDKLNYGDDSPKVPPSPGTLPGQASPANSMGANSNAFNLEFGNGEFTGAELKKIMANDKLTEIALSDPKRAKRILANRQSAARSKERKMRYISELELKVQTLQTEATTLSAQLTMLQRDSAGLSTQNNELKFRLQAMEQQAHLRDALNQALTAEVQRLKLATAAASGDPPKLQQLSESPQMFLRQQQQATQLNAQQLPQQQALHQASQSNSTASAQNESSHNSV